MAIIPVMLYHNGRWDSNNRYVDYNADVIVINSESSYETLVSLIATQLSIDTFVKKITIKYKIDDWSVPMEIRNNMGAQVYAELKKENREIAKYPLCITTIELLIEKEHETNLVPRLCGSDPISTSEILNSYNFDSMIGIDDAIQEVGMGSCAEIEGFSYVESAIVTNPNQEFIEENQVYQQKSFLVSAMKRYSVLHKFEYNVIRSNANCYTIKCSSENCHWSLRASSLNKSGMFKIREYNSKHACLLGANSISERHATTTVVAAIIMKKVAETKSEYTPREIQSDMLNDYGVSLTYMQAWRAKEKALELVRGDPADSYSRLPSYLYMLEKTYPGSHVKLHKADDGHFLYVFVALHASIKGWEYCRPIVVVDGSFLKAAYKGTMLTANTLDAAGSILPLAYVIVDSENDASWQWFFEQFKVAYDQRPMMSIVSDRHDSIIKATSVVYHGVPHFACIWHLWKNVMKNFKKSQYKITELFYTMARAYTQLEFDKNMEMVEKIDKRVKDYLFDIVYSKWSRVHAQVNRTWTMTSNIAESVNSVNKEARELPVLPLLDFMRLLIQKWNNNNRTKATFSAFYLGKKYHEILELNKEEADKMTVRETSVYLYTVIDGITNFTVNLQDRRCSCGRFQLDELPCPHALAIIYKKHLPYEDYCSPYYTKVNLLQTYQFQVENLPDSSTWDVPLHVSAEKLLPPIGKKAAGRLRKSRVKIGEGQKRKRSINSCSNCGQIGHNRKTCRNVRNKN